MLINQALMHFRFELAQVIEPEKVLISITSERLTVLQDNTLRHEITINKP
jgi:hypothetical protein